MALRICGPAHKPKFLGELLHVLIYLGATELHFVGQLGLGRTTHSGRRDHPGKNHCPVSQAALLELSVVRDPERDLLECVREFFDRIFSRLVVGKFVENFVRKIARGNPLVLNPFGSRLATRVLAPVVLLAEQFAPELVYT